MPSCRTLLCSGLAVLLTACGDSPPTQPPLGEPGIRAVLGAGATDTVDAPLRQALVVEVRTPEGRIASGVVVRFEAQPSSDPARRFDPALYVCTLTAVDCGPTVQSRLAIDTTDASGRASVLVRLGEVAGQAVVYISAPERGLLDSAVFIVRPGAATGVRAIASDTAIDIGASTVIRGRVVDRYGNTRAEAPTPAPGIGTAFTIDPATGTVTGRELGTQSVMLRYGAFVDSTSVRVVPGGRLVVWSSLERVVRLVNVNGTNTRTVVSSVSSDLGAFPRFDATRQRVTLHTGSGPFGGTPNTVIVVDTTGAPRWDIGAASGFSVVIAVRQIGDGTVLVVGQRTSTTGFSLWRVAPDSTVSLVAPLAGLGQTYGGADISHDGTRVVYLVGAELRVLNAASGAVTVLESVARSPRWSPQDDRVAFLVPAAGGGTFDGSVVIINANGTGRRALGSAVFSPGLTWSPDGAYIVGRSSVTPSNGALRLLRVSDAAAVLLTFRTPTGGTADYFQPDWR